MSHSTRVRGLKSVNSSLNTLPKLVALYTSAWIEILKPTSQPRNLICRTLHECVDWNCHTLGNSLSERLSHSTRVRGLKLCPCPILWTLPSSHSTRVRGLKYVVKSASEKHNIVALYTSAWIEMISHTAHPYASSVALYTSAWIEIAKTATISFLSRRSHSTRVRGLK